MVQSLSFWYGAKLIRDGDIAITDLLVAFFLSWLEVRVEIDIPPVG
jgi:hypothetical protein